MDTRFWGPSGWKLFHLITFEADHRTTSEHSVEFANFFETIPYILPCKFCRASLTDYYRQHPYQINGKMNLKLDLKKWMFTIHNCVNGKLRKQGFILRPIQPMRKLRRSIPSFRKNHGSNNYSTCGISFFQWRIIIQRSRRMILRPCPIVQRRPRNVRIHVNETNGMYFIGKNGCTGFVDFGSIFRMSCRMTYRNNGKRFNYEIRLRGGADDPCWHGFGECDVGWIPSFTIHIHQSVIK